MPEKITDLKKFLNGKPGAWVRSFRKSFRRSKIDFTEQAIFVSREQLTLEIVNEEQLACVPGDPPKEAVQEKTDKK